MPVYGRLNPVSTKKKISLYIFNEGKIKKVSKSILKMVQGGKKMETGKKNLAIETSSVLGSVAVGVGDKVLLEKEFTAGMRNANELLPCMDELCRQAGWQPGEIEELYISAGPGSFTGIRIAVTVAKSMAFALGTRIVAVPSTDALVLNADDGDGYENNFSGLAAVAIEAKRGMIYAAVYQKYEAGQVAGNNVNTVNIVSYVPGYAVLMEPCVSTAGRLLAGTGRPLTVLGDGLRGQKQELSGEGVVCLGEKSWQPRAGNVYRCGRLRSRTGLYSDPNLLLPIYLRRPEAIERWEKLHGGEG